MTGNKKSRTNNPAFYLVAKGTKLSNQLITDILATLDVYEFCKMANGQERGQKAA